MRRCVGGASVAPIVVLFLCGARVSALPAQMPFYTDDPAVTGPGNWHFEFFNEFDVLQSQYPNLRQNTANFKLNHGLPHHLELDVDAPYLAIFRAPGVDNSAGIGDLDMGIKWEFHSSTQVSHASAWAASLYVELPTGNAQHQLGSGLADYWLNLITQQRLTTRTRVTANVGFVFAGNTSTGVVGIQTTRGHVYTGGMSLLHDFSPKLTLGGELFGGLSDNAGLARKQLQALAGGTYAVRGGWSISFALLGGKYVASPKIGGQLGFAVDFPAVGTS